MVEAQAVDRIYRIGQTQEVTVIRYIVPDSVETVEFLFLLCSNVQLQAADYTSQYVHFVQQEKMKIIDQTNSTSGTVEPHLIGAREKVTTQMPPTLVHSFDIKDHTGIGKGSGITEVGY